MDQNIGLQYTVKGHQEIINANQQLASSLVAVDTQIKRVSTTLGRTAGYITAWVSSLSGAKGAISTLKELGIQGGKLNTFATTSHSLAIAARRTERFRGQLEAIVPLATRAAQRLDTLTGSVTRYAAAVGRTPGLAISGARGGAAAGSRQGGTGSTIIGMGRRPGRDNPATTNEILGAAPWFLLRYRLWSAAMQGATYMTRDVMLGRARAEMAGALGELSAVSFSPIDKAKTEAAARAFSARFWTTTAEQYTQAMSQTASAFYVGDVGFENLRKMNEAVLQFGMLSKMGGEPAAQMMSQWTKTLLSRQPQAVREALESGRRADIPGYGNVDLGDFAAKIVSQMTVAIEKSNIWGPGISAAARHSLPTMLNMGWTPSAALAMYGALVDMGFQPAQTGRSQKEFFTGFPTDAARALLMGTGNWTDPLKLRAAGDTAGAREATTRNEMALKALTPVVTQFLSDPRKAMQFMSEILGPAVERAGKSGFRLTEDMKFSKYFLPQFQTMMKAGFGDVMIKLLKDIEEGGVPEEMYRKALETLDDSGTAYARISNAMSGFFQTIADNSWAHGIVAPIARWLNISTQHGQIEKLAGKTADKDAFLQWVNDQQKLWTVAYGEGEAARMRIHAYQAAGRGHLLPPDEQTAWDNPLRLFGDMGALGKMVGNPFETLGTAIHEGLLGRVDAAKSSIQMLGDAFTWLNERAAALNQTIASMMPWNWFGGGSQIGSLMGEAVAANGSFGEPAPGYGRHGVFALKPPAPLTDATMPGEVSPEHMAGAVTGEPIVIHNVLQLDGSILQEWLTETIGHNRATAYQAFGGDPMGYNEGVAGP